jgi:predicted DNA-binding protein with PD1-like motif
MQSISKRFQSQAASRGKTVVSRLLPGSDLIKGIKSICGQHRIRQAIITTAIGTLLHAELVYVVPDSESALGVKYVEPKRIEGPLELLCGQGAVGEDNEGEPSVHLHAVLSGPDMKLFGGHLVENGNPVLVTAEITMQEILGAEMKRRYDEKTGFVLFQFETADFETRR